ncbi:MAG: inositol monophosphatase family protein [Anaerolineales bacterium]
MPELASMIQAARRAGRYIARYFGRVSEAEQKSHTIDLVTSVDRRAQTLIAEVLCKAFPEYGLLAEENPNRPTLERPYWVVDPLDGTTNFLHGYPMVAVSIALVEGNVVRAAVVYQPLRHELFTAVRGGGARLNGHPIRVSKTTALGKALLASGFPYDAWENPDNNAREWAALLRRVVSLRSDGVASLDLCHVACGRLDGYWELDLDAWDMAAGSLIVSEAGGKISNRYGQPFDIFGRSIVAATPAIHAQLVQALSNKA